jgi:predicted aspartyl protease
MQQYPFYFDGASIIVDGLVRRKSRRKTQQEIRFLIDTGAERSTIHYNVAINMGYGEHLQQGAFVMGIGGSAATYTTKLVSIEVLNIVLNNFEVLVQDYNLGIPAHIILGMDILGRQEFCIDSANQLIKLH